MYMSVYIVFMEKKKYTLYLTSQQIIKLKAIFKKLGVPVSESIRRAIDAYLSKDK